MRAQKGGRLRAAATDLSEAVRRLPTLRMMVDQLEVGVVRENSRTTAP
jgi:hypothetical protein